MIKRITIIILLCILVISLFACRPKDSADQWSSSDPKEQNNVTEDNVDQYTVGDLNTYYKTTVPLTKKTPEEIVSESDLIASVGNDGAYPAVIFYNGRAFSHQGTILTELPEDEWTIAEPLKGPVYPWVRPKENLVSHCLPEATVLYFQEQNGTEKLAAEYGVGFAVFE